jgi:quinol monooxygenase YgiN
MGNEIAWQVELAVKPGELENYRALIGEMVEFTETEPSTLIYEYFISQDGQTIYVYERYADAAAAVAHLLAAGKRFGGRSAHMVEIRRFLVFGMPSAELRAILDRLGATYLALFAGTHRE